MVHSAEFIILAVTKTGEKSLVLHTLSKQWGRRSFICSVSKTSSMAMFLPLNIVEAEVLENPKSDLWRAHRFSTNFPLEGIRGDIYRNTISLFLSEVLFRSIKDGANDPGIYDWCRKSILTLDAMPGDYSNFHLRFLMEYASILGFSPAEGNIDSFAGEHFRRIHDLMSLEFPEFMLYPLSGNIRNEIADILLKYIGHHTESSLNVRSLKVLGEVLR